MTDYAAARARLVAYLTQAGLSTALANANLDALLAAAAELPSTRSGGMRPEDVPHDLVMAGVRAQGALSADSVRAVIAAVLPLAADRTTEK
jgi:hypothetical protein